MICTKFKALMPKVVSDGLAMLFLIIAVSATFYFEIFIVIPNIYDQNYIYTPYIHTFNGSYIIIALFGNFILLITTDSSTTTLLLPSVLKSGWRFCSSCEANSPPRSYHCNICDKCILKRDHHCVFSGCCIGFKNFRYYYGLLIYIAVGALYSTMLNMQFIWTALGGFSFSTFCIHVFPLVFFIFGKLDFKVMLWTFISVLDICGMLFAFGLLYFHGCLVVKNQITFERNHRIQEYNLGNWRVNVEDSLGTNWIASLLCPFVKANLRGNGLEFKTSKVQHLTSNKSK